MSDFEESRRRIAGGLARIEVLDLTVGHLAQVGWAGSPAHLENVAGQLKRAVTGEVVYLGVFADGQPVSIGGIDFAKEPGAGTIWQLATHPELEGLGLATALIRALEERAAQRGIAELRLGVEFQNNRAQRLYEHLGYRIVGESEDSWEAQRSDGSRFVRSARIAEMAKRA